MSRMVQHLATLCADLAFNTQKTHEIVMDFRQASSHAHTHCYIHRAGVERVERQASSSLVSTFYHVHTVHSPTFALPIL